MQSSTGEQILTKEKGRNLAKLMEIDLSEQRLVCTLPAGTGAPYRNPPVPCLSRGSVLSPSSPSSAACLDFFECRRRPQFYRDVQALSSAASHHRSSPRRHAGRASGSRTSRVSPVTAFEEARLAVYTQTALLSSRATGNMQVMSCHVELG